METCDCEDIRERLEEIENEHCGTLLDDEDLIEYLEFLKRMLATIQELKKKLEDRLKNADTEEERVRLEMLIHLLEHKIKKLEELIKKIQQQIDELKSKYREYIYIDETLDDEYNELLNELDECESNLIECDACGKEFLDKEECIIECEGCGRMYCVKCFKESIEAAELAAGVPF